MNDITLLSSRILATTQNSSPPNFIQQLLGGPFIMVLVIMGMMYMLWIRPEQKRAKEHRQLVQRVKAGDRIVTTAGLHGLVAAVNEKTIKVEVDKGVNIEIERAAIGRLEPANEGGK